MAIFYGKNIFLTVLAAELVFGTSAFAADYTGKKILYIDSYHEGYVWSDGITQGIQQEFQGTGVELKIHRMDTKRNAEEASKKQAAQEAKAVIESFQPDVVIASGDNVSKCLIMPYYIK